MSPILGAAPDRRKMSQRHEKYVAELLGGRVHRGSGNQWHNPADGSNGHEEEFAFAWDCKATMAVSTILTREMWRKIVEQAHGLRPAIPVRFYDDPSLDSHVDLVVVGLDDFAEMRQKITELERVVEKLTRETKDLRGGERWIEDQNLAWHLANRHADGMALARSEAANKDAHDHEHTGPGTIRNHDRDDLSWRQDELDAVVAELENP